MKCILLLCLFFSLFNSAFATKLLEQDDVQSFINTMVTQHHYNRQTLEDIFNQVSIKNSIIKAMNRPYESITWDKYRSLFLKKSNIRNGVKFWQKNKTLLATISKKYRVDPAIIVATVGVESAYGRNTGSYRVLDALATLSFDYPRRATFFQNELKEFLLFIKRYHIKPFSVYGSYAGAIGQLQFMPSNVRKYAVTFDHNNPLDLSHNEADIIASIANYYHHNAWRYHHPIATPAILTKNARDNIQNYLGKSGYTLKALKENGITGQMQFPLTTRASVIQLQSKSASEYWLGFHNFYVITRYNPSDFYAMVVYQLASAIKKQHR